MSSLRHINSSTSANHVLTRATGLVALLDVLVLPFTNRYKLNDGFGKATTPITPSCLRISPLTSRFSSSTGATLAPFFVILANFSNSELLADHLGMGLAWGSGAVLPCRGPLRHQGEEHLESWRFAAGGRISRPRSGGRQSAQAAARIGPKPCTPVPLTGSHRHKPLLAGGGGHGSQGPGAAGDGGALRQGPLGGMPPLTHLGWSMP